MSGDLDMLRRLKAAEDTIDRLRIRESAGLYLPFSQRVLNPFPLASSGNSWGEIGQPWTVTVLAFYASVFVSTTNDSLNYWTLALISTAATTIASVSTSAMSAGVWTRLSTASITQPAASNAVYSLIATATGSPGSIVIAPALGVARNGA